MSPPLDHWATCTTRTAPCKACGAFLSLPKMSLLIDTSSPKEQTRRTHTRKALSALATTPLPLPFTTPMTTHSQDGSVPLISPTCDSSLPVPAPPDASTSPTTPCACGELGVWTKTTEPSCMSSLCVRNACSGCRCAGALEGSGSEGVGVGAEAVVREGS